MAKRLETRKWSGRVAWSGAMVMALSDRVKLGAVLVVGVIVPGFADYLLSNAGRPDLGMVVWAGGYAVMILVVWYVWVRPLDFTGPTG